MASSSSSHQQNRQLNAFSAIELAGKRRKVSESSRLFDVFINHRGPDVKQTLATELYNSFGPLGIEAFLDSQEKELGNSFPCIIEAAIRSASVHIAIFSKGYAESPWCLTELVLMIETKAKIIPVFYEVKPSDLRHIEKGIYADAFVKYEEKGRYLEKLSEWKEALQTLSFIAGVEFPSSSDCKTIVAAVEKEVQRKRCLHVAKYPVGLNNLVEDFEKRCLHELVQDFENQCGLEERKNKPNIVGIFGMGGVGKTTLAKELFNRKQSDYFRASFLFDVREASVRSELPHLQSQLIKDLFQTEQSFRSIEAGTSYLKRHLQRSHSLRSHPLNYLIVVDDVDHVEQLDALLIKDILNNSGNSLIIVTTRDVGVVISAGITVGYPLKGMGRNHGRQLFCWHAFDQPLPCSGYEALVDQFVDVCGGLPLSLQVLGRLVHGRSHSYWELKLIKARETLSRDVKNRLRISFDTLDDEEKQVFMDIACFFVGKPKCMAERIWKESGWDVQNALETLKDKCLLEEKLEEDNFLNRSRKREIVLRMHDHLRDLGREMALELSSPPRLWHPRDLESLELMGLETILAKTNSRCLHSIFDDSMDSQVTFFLSQSCRCVETPASLIWLQLEGFKTFGRITEQPTIPSWIPLHNLQCLKILGGRFKSLWENRIQIFPSGHQLSTSCRDLQRVSGSGDLIKLRELFISDCPELEELTSLSRLNCVENIEIQFCDKLQNIMLPTTLISLSVQSCRDLQRVSGSGDLIKLTKLFITKCPELEELPSHPRLSCMEKIKIHSCEKLQNITLPTTLISLSVHSCRDLQRVRASSDLIKLTELFITECPELEELPSLSRLSYMEKIKIHSCEKLHNIMLPTTLICLSVRCFRDLQRAVGFSDLINLTELFIIECPEFEELPSFFRLSCLEKIKIYSCEKLQNITLPTTLISLSVHSCRDLQRVVGSSDLIKLTELFITECPELEELPSLSKLSCMENFKIDSCEKLQSITLPKTLINLCVQRCRDLQRVGVSCDLIKLKELIISDCPELEELPSLSRLSCMEKITIHLCEKLQSIKLPTALISLSVHSCKHLQRVVGSGDLIKLTKLSIIECPELEELPSFSRLSCVEKIEIDSCEKLEKISGIEELGALQCMRLRHCSNAVLRDRIHKLKSVPRKLNMIGRAVDGAESSLNKDLFCDVPIGTDALTEIVTQNSGYVDINEWCKKWEVTRAAVIVCYLVVVESSTSAEDITKSFKHTIKSSQFYAETLPIVKPSQSYAETWPGVKSSQFLYAKTWPSVREGEWIITMVASDEGSYNFNCKNVVDVLSGKKVMKGIWVEVKKGEEWKCVSVLHTIVDRLHI